jgi:hypothetical protein
MFVLSTKTIGLFVFSFLYIGRLYILLEEDIVFAGFDLAQGSH